ncbi:hypothetical protein [Bacillus thuringiensis]|nr:hypothetical protein [Bacillus thuringiensis]
MKKDGYLNRTIFGGISVIGGFYFLESFFAIDDKYFIAIFLLTFGII